MAKGQILKKRDSDLLSNNIKPGVNIFGVAGSYGGLVGGQLPLGLAYSGNDDDIFDGFHGFNDIRFYDEGTKIICMGAVTAQVEGGFLSRCFYYLEINKDTLVVSNHKRLVIQDPAFTGTVGVGMSIQNIGGIDRYCFSSAFGDSPHRYASSVYFDGTNLVSGGAFGVTMIGSTTIDLFSGSEIIQYTANNVWNQSVGPGGTPPGQQFTTLGTTTKVGMVEVFMKDNGGIYSGSNISCQIYNNNYTTLLGTSINSFDPNDITTSEQSFVFIFPDITLSPSTQYAFRLTNSFTSSNGGVVRINYASSNLYSGGVFNNNTSVDLKFKLILGDYKGRLSGGSVNSGSIDGAYNDIGRTYGTLNFG